MKALYDFKQALRAWYERLSELLINSRYNRGRINKTVLVKNDWEKLMVAQIYVDDTVFGGTSDTEWRGLCGSS